MYQSPLFSFVLIFGHFTSVNTMTTDSALKLSTDVSSLHSLTYSSTPVTWEKARAYCLKTNGALPVVEQASDGYMGYIRTVAKSNGGADVWTGNYKTFDVIKQERTGPSPDTLCVAATLTQLTARTPSTEYGFNLTATNCSMKHKVICRCLKGLNEVSLYIPNSIAPEWLSADGTCQSHNERCSLWLPDLDLYKMATGHVIGQGKVWLGGDHAYIQFRETFWVNLRVREQFGTVQHGKSLDVPKANEPFHLFECGFISNHGNGLTYGPCDEHKSILCETGQAHGPYDIKQNGPEADGKSRISPGGYIAIIVTAVLSILSVSAVLVWRFKFRKRLHGRVNDVIPRGGRSFRPAPADTESYPKPDTDDTYATASPIMVTKSPQNYLNPQYTEKQKRNSKRPVPYATTQLFNNAIGQTKVETVDAPAYLTMDGTMEQKTGNQPEQENVYDSIRNSCIVHDVSEGNGNVYNMASQVDSVSVYNSTLDRHSSRRNLVGYDHVVLNNEESTVAETIANKDNAQDRVRSDYEHMKHNTSDT